MPSYTREAMERLVDEKVNRISEAFQDSEAIAISALRLINDRSDDLRINSIIACMIMKHFLEMVIEDSNKNTPEVTKVVQTIVNQRMNELHRHRKG